MSRAVDVADGARAVVLAMNHRFQLDPRSRPSALDKKSSSSARCSIFASSTFVWIGGSRRSRRRQSHPRARDDLPRYSVIWFGYTPKRCANGASVWFWRQSPPRSLWPLIRPPMVHDLNRGEPYRLATSVGAKCEACLWENVPEKDSERGESWRSPRSPHTAQAESRP